MVCCEVCNEPIDSERLEVLPNTTTCPVHSRAVATKGFMVYPHKTGGEVLLVKGDDKEALRQAERAFRRAR